jgi:hypothetical protein
MNLRAAQANDIDDVLEMYRGIQDDVSLTESLAYCLTRNMDSDRMILALEEERPVGFLWSQLSTDPESGERVDEVKVMIIARDMFGKGVGGILLESEQEFAAKKHATLLKISVKPDFTD